MKALKFGLIAILAILLLNTKSIVASEQPSQSSLKTSIARGKELYLTQCLTCHQVDGGGVPHLNPPLDGSANVKGKDKTKIILTVLNGLKGEELEGETYSAVMVPHRELKDQQIADILTYVRNSWTNKASQVTAAEVKAVRAKLK
jgi:mono/diheme cytochrome c family protein